MCLGGSAWAVCGLADAGNIPSEADFGDEDTVIRGY